MAAPTPDDQHPNPAADSQSPPNRSSLPNEDATPAESIRRVGTKDRKTQLPSAGGLFPLEDRMEDHRDDRFPPVAPQLPDEAPPKNLRPRRKQPMAAKRNRRRSRRQNTIALVFFVATFVIGGYFAYLWQNPYSPLNLFAPQVLVTYVTATPQGFAPTPNPFSTTSSAHLQLAPQGITYAANNANCAVFVVSGAFATADNTPPRYAVRLSGHGRDEGVFTGNVPGIGANAFWFEIPYAGLSASLLTLEVFDTAGSALLEPISVTVRSGCDENLAVVSFRQKPTP